MPLYILQLGYELSDLLARYRTIPMSLKILTFID